MNDQQLLRMMSRIGGLLHKKFNDELNATEQAVLDTWLAQQESHSSQFFEEITEWDQVQVALQTIYDFDSDAALADIQKKIPSGFTPIHPPQVNLPRPRLRRISWLAAAIVIIIAGASALHVFSKRKTEITIASISQRYKNEIAPGGNRAKLTMADGSQILLDDAAKGELARQGGTRILKLDSGLLSYRSGQSTAATLTYNTISTPRGGQYQVILADGTKVWLNAASSLRFPTSFAGNERLVELSGEAYFHVAKNASSPFRVSVVQQVGAESLGIEVLGTEFNVMCYADEVDQRTTLINGIVKITYERDVLTLEPGQQVCINSSSPGLLDLIPAVNIDEVVAWKKGVFQFHDAPIEEIMREVSRWYDVEVVYSGKVDQQFIGTISRQVKLSTLLKILEATGWVHFTIEGRKITVSR